MSILEKGNVVDRVADALRGARRVLVLTGAGISAESGIPTFRGKDGWWRQRNPQELATLEAFTSDPGLVWEWYEHRRAAIARAEPNLAHQMLAWLEAQGKDVFVVTQNVDDLHERAGSKRIVHVHGSIWRVKCMRDGKAFDDRRVPLRELPPKCECGALLRPAVVWFGEMLPVDALAEIDGYFSQGTVDVALVIGTYSTFGYIQGWALEAKRRGALLVEVNPDETPLSPSADVNLRGRAGELLEEVKARLGGETANPRA